MMMGTVYIGIASIIWGVVHSVLASHGCKQFVKKILGAPAYFKLYRFSYNIFALASFFPILLMLMTFPDKLLYNLPSPWVYLMIVGQGMAFIGIVAAVMQTDALDFAGLAQLASGPDASKPATLVVNGLYAHVRHPIYISSLAFLWLSPEMTENRLVLWIVLSFYFVIGAKFEERKLMTDFGSQYAEYMRRTPMLIPHWR
jgi:protein-S-isoprenylcysteine O-methyltransferase Ste14